MSKDTDVEMRLHFKAFINDPYPNDAFDFIIVTDEVLTEIKEFKQKEIARDIPS